MKGRSTEKAHSSRVGRNWVMTGLCINQDKDNSISDSHLLFMCVEAPEAQMEGLRRCIRVVKTDRKTGRQER